MQTLYMLVGVQASGKSTYAAQELKGLEVLSSDNWFYKDGEGRMYWIDKDDCQCYYSQGLTPQVLSRAWRWVWHRFGELIQGGEPFILEGTYPTRISRNHVIHIAKAFGYQVEVVWFNTPLDECIRRNRERINFIPETVLARTYASMEPPSWEEGFDHVFVLPRHG